VEEARPAGARGRLAGEPGELGDGGEGAVAVLRELAAERRAPALHPATRTLLQQGGGPRRLHRVPGESLQVRPRLRRGELQRALQLVAAVERIAHAF
jgi:hypothetical protein